MNVKVEELMVTDVVTTDTENDIAEVANLMLERSVGCVIVVNENEVAGLITDRDLLECLRSAHDAGLCPVSHHMSSPVVTIEPQANVATAATLMTQDHVKRLPVVGTAGLVGILSFADIAGFLHDSADKAVPDLEALSALIKAGALHRRT